MSVTVYDAGMTESIVRFKNFEVSPEPVTFTIAPDTFECLPEVPLDVLVELSGLRSSPGETVDLKARMAQIHDFFDFIMESESAALFRKRTAIPTKEQPNPNPIGMKTVIAVLEWLMEVYGLRPTQPSSESEDGSQVDEASSTDGASVAVSTS